MMTTPFEQLSARMDKVTAERMSKQAVIEGETYQVVEETQSLEMAALNGEGIVLVVFSDTYIPRRQHAVTWKGQEYVVTEHRRFNGKPLIRIE
ncbi:MAG TPA: ATP-binding protein [Buttiauxella sp.]